MKRSTCVFGNGLGMAIDPSAFSLGGALERVWNDPKELSDDQKSAIIQCLPDGSNSPTSEDDLEQLQNVLAACDLLNAVSGGTTNHWLSDQGKIFPKAIRKFVHEVACEFIGTSYELPEKFTSPLCEYIRETKSHIATLNYDDLLYSSLLNEGILSGYSGYLIDGVLDSGFVRENLHRKISKNLGWYMHLHGSPLFYTDRKGRVRKMRRSQIVGNEALDSTHIVLTHARHKPSIINSSTILSTYWLFLKKAVKESSRVTFVGYSGLDTHLNDLVARFSGEKEFRIVEWSGAGSRSERLSYWRDKLRSDVDLFQLDSILDYSDW
jgi:hypothetical protein